MTHQIRTLLLIALALLPMQVLAQAVMFVKIEVNGEVITTGEATGRVRGIDTEEYAPALDYGWGSDAQSDPATGLPTGKRQHRALTVIKPLARSSVLLRQALERNDDIGLELRLFSPDAAGRLEEVWRIELANGFAVRIRPFIDAATGEYLEEIQFLYGAIVFTDVRTDTSVFLRYPRNP